MDRQPELKFKRSPCPQCGARTEKQAETMCKQTLGYDDEYHCSGEFDAKGWSMTPTTESLAALEAWYGEQLKQQAL